MSGKLEGKVAVVTGGNSGIGLATAERFVAEGAYVFITERRQAELDAAVKHIGRNVTAVRGDVSKLKELGIRVNALSPGIIPTPGYHKVGLTTEDRVQEFIDGQANSIPLGRAGTADEIAKVAVFLASDDSSYVTAADLVVDGGVSQV